MDDGQAQEPLINLRCAGPKCSAQKQTPRGYSCPFGPPLAVSAWEDSDERREELLGLLTVKLDLPLYLDLLNVRTAPEISSAMPCILSPLNS